MTTIRLRNSKTRKVEEFIPIDPKDVRMYVCGPTVYDRAHLGNARPVLVFDVLYRLLRHVYGADHVTYVRNFTDVDDKINAEAQRRKAAGDPGSLEELIAERTEETIGWYHADMDALGALRPDHEPRATAFIDQMIAMIETLIERGHAYVVRVPSNNPPKEFVLFDDQSRLSAHSLFDVESFEDYGQLSGRSLNDMIAGARVEVAPYKRNPMDFVLWKPSDDDLPGWDSTWGRGRPGWHIECSAMSLDLLGPSFDIHGGGIDLQFPHHENEIAQSCCALASDDDPLGRDKFARYWVHNEMLQVEGRKMSKSLGNFFTVRDLLDQGVPGEVIRFVMLGTHYSKPMDWTERKREEAETTLRKWHEITVDLDPTPEAECNLDTKMIDALGDDLNTHLALTYIRALQGNPQKLLDHARWFGFLLDKSRTRFLEQTAVSGHGSGPSPELASLASKLDVARNTARASKDYSEVDRLRAALIGAGVEVRMQKGRVELVPGPNFDPAKLEALK